MLEWLWLRIHPSIVDCFQEDAARSGRQITDYSQPYSDEMLVEHNDYLQKILENERDRHDSIERKNLQLVGQAGVVVSLLSVVVTVILDKIDSWPLGFKVIVVALLLLVLLAFVAAIFYATDSLVIRKYKYPMISASTVYKDNRSVCRSDFLFEYNKDLIFVVNQAVDINNQKGSNLIRAACLSRCAYAGIFLFVVIVGLNSLLFSQKPKPTGSQIEITSPIRE